MTSDISTNRDFAEYLASAFKQVDWPIPPYLNLGFLSPLAKAIKDAPQDAKLAIIREKLAGAYTADYHTRLTIWPPCISTGTPESLM
jgi:hypothetical protein